MFSTPDDVLITGFHCTYSITLLPVDTPYTVTVCENLTTPGLNFFQVEATDLDSPPNNEIQFSLVDGNGLFDINPSSGEISFVSFIDYEIIMMVSIGVVATDNGSPSLSSNSSVFLRICDSNDNAPLFSTNDFGTIPITENSTVGALIFTLTVEDLDSGANGEISLFIDNVFPSECEVS